MPTVTTSTSFEKSFRKLPLRTQVKTVELKEEFSRAPFASHLRTHKLHGQFSGCHAFSIDRNYRVVFQFLTSEQVIFLDIGTHAIYK